MNIDALFYLQYNNVLARRERNNPRAGMGEHIIAKTLRAMAKQRAKGRKVYSLADRGGHW